MTVSELQTALEKGAFSKTFDYLYGEKAGAQPQRYANTARTFEACFGEGRSIELFSAPGRTEVGGNHTDHQHGRVLAASVNLDVIAAASKNTENIIRIQSEGYPMDTVDLSDLSVQEAEKNKAAALIRGIAARFAELGLGVGGFDAYTTSNVLKGSGLSSSAAFETLVGTILNGLYADGKATPVQIAQIGQFAENTYFGKPCGLMDEMACSVGGFITIDFSDPANPSVEKVETDFSRYGYKLCIVDTGGNHADLTGDYAAVPSEMRTVAQAFGKDFLRDVPEADFYNALPRLRESCTDRALLRAMHFFSDNARVPLQAAALRGGDFEAFKRLIIESGDSSFSCLQNVFSCKNPTEQGLSLGLAVSRRLLSGKGAWRVHGGGFAGTIQCFVPDGMLDAFRAEMEAVFGQGKCHVLSIRPTGGAHITAES